MGFASTILKIVVSEMYLCHRICGDRRVGSLYRLCLRECYVCAYPVQVLCKLTWAYLSRGFEISIGISFGHLPLLGLPAPERVETAPLCRQVVVVPFDTIITHYASFRFCA